MKEDTTTQIKKLSRSIGHNYRHWIRPVMYEKCTELVAGFGPKEPDVLEISPGWFWHQQELKSYTVAPYPEFDIYEDKLGNQLDLIIAGQVWEHLLRPCEATRHACELLKPGGHFLVTTPFLIKVHAIPNDCSRWTEKGMKYFLAECGFPLEDTVTDSWGNRAGFKANFARWARRDWLSSLRNEHEFPVAVWALARKPH